MGIFLASIIILSWCLMLWSSMTSGIVRADDPVFYLRIAAQAFLYTGLFITAHDAMHGTVSKNRSVNHLAGSLACFLFAGFSYGNLRRKHFLHHAHPTGSQDPDFGQRSQNFFLWFFGFIRNYISLTQLIIMAAAHNLLSYYFGESKTLSFWLIPSVISSLQLFYFGTYLPHRHPENGLTAPHFARSQKKNHLAALLSCYFFGYHHEHHSSPGTPWWKLPALVGSSDKARSR